MVLARTQAREQVGNDSCSGNNLLRRWHEDLHAVSSSYIATVTILHYFLTLQALVLTLNSEKYANYRYILHYLLSN